ncbi:MAG TPA: hypothetical protein VIA45_09420 [Thermoanaerobaculia bacterium]|jgi:hypothetical protein
MRPARRLAATLCAAALLGGCQSGGSAPSPAAVPSTPTPAPAPAPSPVPTELPPPAAYVPGQPASESAGERPYEKILRLAQGGASTEALLAAVRADAGSVRYDLTTPEILELRRAGVAEEVVEAMLRSGQPK